MQYSKTEKNIDLFRQTTIIWNMLSSFQQRLVSIALLTLVVVILLHMREGRVITISNLGSVTFDHSPSMDRPHQYCNKQMWVTNKEGRSFQGHDEWKLSYIVATIRHGDRSSIHHVPNSKSPPLATALQLLDNEAILHSKGLSSFKLEIKANEIATANSEQEIDNALNTNIAFHTADLNLTQGQLTSRGFMQHVHLGHKLQSAYSELVDRVRSNNQLYVRSTKYIRTIQSVAGLMTSLLPPRDSTDEVIPIIVYNNEEDEIMHGIGLRTSSHTVGSVEGKVVGGETEFTGSCDAAITYAKRQKEVFKQSSRLEHRLVEIFGNGVLNKTLNEIADASVPRLCHGHSLPCSESGAVRRSFQQQCMQHGDLLGLMEEADRHYCEKYTGDEGGHNATSLAIYPFMKEIMSHLSSDTVSSARRLSLFSGHDTVIAPVLAALGVYKDELCGWPAYASHILFERWTHKTAPVDSVNGHANTYVRVLYNGIDLTQHIPTCADERHYLHQRIRDSSNTVSNLELDLVKYSSPLCSLAALSKQIDSLIHPHESIQDACKLD